MLIGVEFEVIEWGMFLSLKVSVVFFFIMDIVFVCFFIDKVYVNILVIEKELWWMKNLFL